MKKIISVISVVMAALLLLVPTSTLLAADEVLDIEKVAIQALKNSQTVQSIERRVQLAQSSYKDITAMMDNIRGTIAFTGSYQTVVATIVQPLEAENRLTQAVNSQLVNENATRMSSYKAYIDLLKANFNLTIQQGLMDDFHGEYKKAQLQQKLGMLSQSQFRLIEIDYFKAQHRYNSALNSFDSASMAVNYMMGENLAKRYSEMKDNNIKPADSIKTLTEYVNLALANRAEIINAQDTLDARKKAYELGRAAIPTDYEFYCQQQQYAIDSAQNDFDLAKINVEQDIINIYRGLDGALKNVQAMKALNDQAVQNCKAAEVRYKNSQTTLHDLEEVKVQKAQAAVNLKNAEFDAWLVQNTMQAACEIGYNPLALY
ncbi:MAG: TolC family protein [Clostridia bacterium]|nr:TolC family protein [Clostridia bacterium]